MPLVSVVIPVHNRASLLEEALASVVRQTWRDLEVIVVDDGSEDGSAEVGERRGARVVRMAHCGRPGKVRNVGVEHARGDLVAFLDSDDLWEPEKLSRQMAVWEGRAGEGIPLVHAREVWMRKGRIVSQAGQVHRREGDVFPWAVRKCIIGPSTVLMERRVFEDLGGFREDLEIAEDYEFWLRLTDRYPVAYLDEPVVVKRAGDWEQLSEKYGHIEVFRIMALKPLVDEDVFLPEHRGVAREELLRKCEVHARGARKRGRMEEAERFLSCVEAYRRGEKRAPDPWSGLVEESDVP
ncbi:glycosyl transferase family 2 [Spirochaeta thermophila DSM 6578]|uniref:Glycosyl transferase family 2 n=1 Tax=Winmispira thermophila (strain ATCC 700085 / DSM 6578 / Z-1203) TaxID=869211 RepID=G0GBL6_WINT7|nr:glycosyltransferase family A protein [Spirochaeta thermophila]AEJ60375.1 glycosyl transferase family 2 [Spirochaeta thermophila DSM 6578]